MLSVTSESPQHLIMITILSWIISLIKRCSMSPNQSLDKCTRWRNRRLKQLTTITIMMMNKLVIQNNWIRMAHRTIIITINMSPRTISITITTMGHRVSSTMKMKKKERRRWEIMIKYIKAGIEVSRGHKTIDIKMKMIRTIMMSRQQMLRIMKLINNNSWMDPKSTWFRGKTNLSSHNHKEEILVLYKRQMNHLRYHQRKSPWMK